MNFKVEFELVSPEKILISEPVDMVVVPGGEGNFGVLAGHISTIATVRIGVIEMYDEERLYDRIFVHGGFAEVYTEEVGERIMTRCTVLVEEAIKVDELKQAEVELEVKNLREDVEDAREDNEREAALAKLAIARAKLEIFTGSYIP